MLAQSQPGRRGPHPALGPLPRPDRDRRATLAPEVRGQLFLGEHAIDRVLLDGDIVSVGRAVDELSRPRLVEHPRLGDGPEHLLVLRVEQPRDLLAKLGRHPRLGQRIGRRLVGRDLDEVRAEPEACQTVGEKRAGARETERRDHARGHQEDLVACACQVVGARGVRRRPGHDPLARPPQLEHELANVLQGRHRHPDRAQVQDDALDPRVTRDRLETLAQVAHAQPRPGGKPLPQRSRRVWQRRQSFLEYEHDELGRLADRAPNARDQPPQPAKRKQQHPSASGGEV